MNELALIAHSLVAQGNYKGAVIAAQHKEDVLLEGAGTLQLGRLVVTLLAAYMREMPKEKRDMMGKYVCKKAKEMAENAPAPTEA